MLRKQIFAVGLTACLALASGCTTVSNWTSSLFHRPVVCSAECEMGTGSCCGGAVMEEAGPYLGAPTDAGMPSMGPGSCVAPTGPQRIVPQPAAQPDPYQPTNARPRLLSAFQK
jgi:hypothetical protein